MFITTQMGVDALSTYDKYILNKFGFDIKKIVREYPPYLQSFMFGRLTAWLSDNQANSIVYSDFKTYLNSNQYFPLTEKEKTLYDISISRSYTHIKNLGEKRKDELTHQISEEDVRRELSDSIKDRTTISNIVSNWGHLSNNWNRDYGRIAETEMNTIMNLGRATQFEKRYGKDVLCWKKTFPLACRHCQRLHTTNGVGSEPILQPLSKIISNGSNIGRRVDDWLFTIASEHPHCRCLLEYFLKGMIWNAEKKDFDWPEKYVRNIERKSVVHIQVGDKHFEA